MGAVVIGRIERSYRWLRLPSPLIEPDVRISRIRLSDGLHRKARSSGGSQVRGRSRSTPSTPKTTDHG